MGGRNKSRRFVHQGAQTVQKHSEKIPFYMTMAEAEERKAKNVEETSLGGI